MMMVLSQEEIDSLLSTISTGSASNAAAATSAEAGAVILQEAPQSAGGS